MAGVTRGFGRAPRGSLALAAAIAVIALAPGMAHAQRGGDFATREPAVDTPRSGFPGAFNTHMAERGSVVGNLPFFHLDYGVTDNLTVGINVLPLMPALAGEWPGLLARLRYRLYEEGRLSAVASLQAGFVPIDVEDEQAPDRGYGLYASTTVGYQLSPRQRLAATALAATVRLENDAYLETSQFGLVGLAVDYEAFVNDRFGVNVTAGGTPAIVSAVDSPGASGSITFYPALQNRVLVRALGLVRLGDAWLLEAGAAAPLSLSVALPWLSVTKTW